MRLSSLLVPLAFATAAFLLVDIGEGLCAAAPPDQAAFDAPEVRAASDVVPPALLAGLHYRVDPTVRTFAFMNEYSVTSDYGVFERRAMPGCADWCKRSQLLRNCKRSTRAMLSPRRRSRREKGSCKAPSI